MIDFRLLRHLWYFVAVAEEKHFDDEGAEEYALVWNVDIRGWHNA